MHVLQASTSDICVKHKKRKREIIQQQANDILLRTTRNLSMFGLYHWELVRMDKYNHPSFLR
jgi:hypothetical protein